VVPLDPRGLVQGQVTSTRGRAHALPYSLEGVYAMTIKRYGGRYWAVYDASGTLVCVCLYKKGAQEVVRHLTSQEPAR
jgi:hypothetical protein